MFEILAGHDFWRHLAGRGLQPRTIETYREAAGTLAALGLESQPTTREIQKGLKRHALSLSRQRIVWALLRHVQAFASEHNHVAPFLGERPKLRDRRDHLPKALSDDTIDLLLAAAQADSVVATRAVLLLYGCGLRASEACSIRAEDLRPEGLYVKGKGGQVRRVVLVDAVRTQLNLQGDRGFLLHREGAPLTRQQLYKLIRKIAKAAGVVEHVFPHALRHTLATDLLVGGANLRDVQSQLGHKRIATTEAYTRATLQRLQETYVKSHPHA